MFKILKGAVWVCTGFGFCGLWRPFKATNYIQVMDNMYTVIGCYTEGVNQKYQKGDKKKIGKFLKRLDSSKNYPIDFYFGLLRGANIVFPHSVGAIEAIVTPWLSKSCTICVIEKEDVMHDVEELNANLKSMTIRLRPFSDLGRNIIQNEVLDYGEISKACADSKIDMYCEDCGDDVFPTVDEGQCACCWENIEDKESKNFKKYQKAINKLLIEKYEGKEAESE